MCCVQTSADRSVTNVWVSAGSQEWSDLLQLHCLSTREDGTVVVLNPACRFGQVRHGGHVSQVQCRSSLALEREQQASGSTATRIGALASPCCAFATITYHADDRCYHVFGILEHGAQCLCSQAVSQGASLVSARLSDKSSKKRKQSRSIFDSYALYTRFYCSFFEIQCQNEMTAQ